MKMYCVVEKLLAFCLVKLPCSVGLQCYRQTTFYCFVNILNLSLYHKCLSSHSTSTLLCYCQSKGVAFNKATDQYLGFFHQQPLEDFPVKQRTKTESIIVLFQNIYIPSPPLGLPLPHLQNFMFSFILSITYFGFLDFPPPHRIYQFSIEWVCMFLGKCTLRAKRELQGGHSC